MTLLLLISINTSILHRGNATETLVTMLIYYVKKIVVKRIASRRTTGLSKHMNGLLKTESMIYFIFSSASSCQLRIKLFLSLLQNCNWSNFSFTLEVQLVCGLDYQSLVSMIISCKYTEEQNKRLTVHLRK